MPKASFFNFKQMDAKDTYKTISGSAESTYTEKRSKFIATVIPVSTVDEVHSLVKQFQNKYYDARHVCYAYMLGTERTDFRANDNGEPSGTAGKPILGQINSKELTNILIIVVRYFGGIKLGTSGLIVAYRTAAAQAIAEADIIEKTIDADITILFEYPFLNGVMHIIKKQPAVEIISQQFDMDCKMVLRIRQSLMDMLRSALLKVDSLRIEE
jgi:uncharacterized YigZ family protein